jgi:Ca2+/Na+ antiporter
MTNTAKLYIAGVNAAGLTFLVLALLTWHSANPVYYAAFAVLALLGATRKIRLPGMTATMSLNFLFILIGISQFSYSETLVMATAAALAQSLWNASQRPKLVQTLFGAATMSVSTALTYFFSNLALNSASGKSLAGLLMLATSLLLLFNTGLVAGVIALVDHKRLTTVWRGCYMHAFPYFAIGAALAGAVCSAEKVVGWQSTLLLVPFTYLLYIFYRFHLERQARPGHEAEAAAD